MLAGLVLPRLEGSPPRVRSRRIGLSGCLTAMRITSACAEQTLYPQSLGKNAGDHLRVCGADRCDGRSSDDLVGSPPRVRSRRDVRVEAGQRAGITSACAEQTDTTARAPHRKTDHLRVCGADLGTRPDGVRAIGSPPRVRSRRAAPVRGGVRPGITSACAEQTSPRRRRWRP